MFTIAAVGDVRVVRDDPDTLFAHVKDHINKADIAFCQSESSYSDKGSMGSSGPRGASPRDISGYPAIVSAGFDVVSMASNHTMDWGRDALLDCIERMRSDGIQTIGAGKDIDEARQPAIFERDGTKVAFLGYCSVAPKGYYAVPGRAGVAPLRAITHYEQLEEDQPGTPAQVMTWAIERDVDALVDDVKAAKQRADIVIVSAHWGIHHIRTQIADYQPTVAHAAVDAGADLILGHHAHILKGIEIYRGKVIFYGLGDFAMDRGSRLPDEPWRAQVQKLYRQYGTPGPGNYRDNAEASYSMIAKIGVEDGAINRVGFLPVVINAQREPESAPVSTDRGETVYNYVRTITNEANLNAKFAIDVDEVIVET